MVEDSTPDDTTIPLSYRMAKNVVTIELHGGPDERGRHHFTKFYWHDGFHEGPRWRAQCFHANYGHYLERIRQSGRRPVVVQKES